MNVSFLINLSLARVSAAIDVSLPELITTLLVAMVFFLFNR